MKRYVWLCAICICSAACTRADPAAPPALGSSAGSAAAAAPAAARATAGLVIVGSCFEKANAECLETPLGIEKTGCEAMAGTPLSGPCPTADRIATCRQLTEGVETAAVHYYKGFAGPVSPKELCDGKGSAYHYVAE